MAPLTHPSIAGMFLFYFIIIKYTESFYKMAGSAKFLVNGQGKR